MSNRVSIVPTEFVNVRSGDRTLGVRVYDDEGQSYDNTWETIPDDDMDLIKKVLQSDDINIVGMMDFIQENEKGLSIDGNWYDWEQIKDCWE